MWDEGVKVWDKCLTGLAGGLMILIWIVAALDLRFAWTPPRPLPWHMGGLVFHVLGYALFLWAMASNAFFAEGVRVQRERGHVVASGGPYRWVRHPGYVGAILAQTATPFLLGSLWALIPAASVALVFVLRTSLEDRTLRAELAGYQDYARRTRFRLLPGLW
jgi:protein-S-isoprenylcysteine O-methyltransferase Ste14